MTVAIGLDLGTTSIKALALDPSGEILAVASLESPARHERPGRSEQDPDHVYECAVACIADVARRVSERGMTVQGIGISAAMHSLLAVDSNGSPLTGSITWGDNRALAQTEAIKEREDWLGIYKRTGTPVHAMTPLPKLIWFRDEDPGLWRRAARWASIKDYLTFKFCGQWALDHSAAATSGLLSLDRLDWDADVLALTGVDPSALSTPVPCTYVFPPLRADVRRAMGVSEDCKIVAGGSDGALANVGVGAFDPGVVACSIGTSGAVRTFAAEPLLDERGRLFCYPFVDGHYLIGGPINNGGVTLQWVRDNLYPELEEAEIEGGPTAYSVIDERAEGVAAGADGLLFLPYLLGERAPYWNASARGVLFGLTVRHGRDHIARAALEGVIFQLGTVARVLEDLIGEPAEIRVTGGFTRSPLWCQIMADVLGREVVVPVSEHGSAVGGATVAMFALGAVDSLHVKDPTPDSRFAPDASRRSTYAVASDSFRRIYERLEPEFEAGQRREAT